MTTLQERMGKLPRARRKKVEERARALIAEEMSLQDLRRARQQTQVRVAKELGINQENVSRLEKRSDLLISTLRGYVKAMGGKLSLSGRIPRPSTGCADRYCGAGQGRALIPNWGRVCWLTPHACQIVAGARH